MDATQTLARALAHLSAAADLLTDHPAGHGAFFVAGHVLRARSRVEALLSLTARKQNGDGRRSRGRHALEEIPF